MFNAGAQLPFLSGPSCKESGGARYLPIRFNFLFPSPEDREGIRSHSHAPFQLQTSFIHRAVPCLLGNAQPPPKETFLPSLPSRGPALALSASTGGPRNGVPAVPQCTAGQPSSVALQGGEAALAAPEGWESGWGWGSWRLSHPASVLGSPTWSLTQWTSQ